MNKSDSLNNEELVQREQIGGTPFWAEGNDNDGYYLRMGRHRLTIETFKNKEEVLEYINYNMYDIILKMIIGVTADKEEWAIEELRKRTQEELNIHN